MAGKLKGDKSTKQEKEIKRDLTPEETKSVPVTTPAARTDTEEVRIGVFVCDCGINIAGFLDVPEVVEYAKTLPNVTMVQENMYTCSDAGIAEIKNGIRQHNLNRVIVASCTPRTHAPLFMAACEAAGLNKYLFEFVNIRDQCSWIHMKNRSGGTEKAKRLIQMGVAKVSLLEPLFEREAPVEPVGMVIGGGIAGLTAANSLAQQGFQVHLVERENELGGKLLKINELYPDNVKPKELIESLVENLNSTGRVKVHLNSEIENVEGYIGNFNIDISRNGDGGKPDKVKVGTVIIATGSKEYKPEGLYGYGKFKNVITQLDLEGLLAQGSTEPVEDRKSKVKGQTMDNNLSSFQHVAMIQCVGARGQHVTYCSKTCCMVAVKNARTIKKLNPDAEIHIFHRDMQTYGKRNEAYYLKAREEGIHFIHFDPSAPPEVTEVDGKLHIKVHSPTLNKYIETDNDVIVLSTPTVQHEDAKRTAQMFKLPLGGEGFFFEAHVKLRPLDFATDGVFLCGNARGPSTVGETVQQALGAASRAAIPLARGNVRAEAITAKVDQTTCIGCGNCMASCPYNAIELKDIDGKLKAEVNDAMCKGCGTCVASCYNGAIQQQGYTDKQLLSMINALSQAYGGA